MMGVLWVITSCLLVQQFQFGRCKESDNIEKKIKEKLLKPEVYNPKIKPDGVTTVAINLFIISIHSVENKKMDFNVQFYIRQYWKDLRLAYENTTEELTRISLSNPESIWTPDLYFANERDGKLQTVVFPNQLINIYPDGEVDYASRVSVKLTCDMDFEFYPLDFQECSIYIDKDSKDSEDVDLVWKEKPVKISPNLTPPDFTIKDVLYDYSRVEESPDHYVKLRVDILMQRKIGFYMIQLYVPFSILVALSWLSFWLDQKFVILRIPLLLTVLGMLTILTTGINASLPSVAYTKAIDVWTTTCLCFVISALLQFILVYSLAKREFYKKKKTTTVEDAETELSYPKDNREVSERLLPKYLYRHSETSTRIDILCRLLFPVLFVLFNIIYWTTYTLGNNSRRTLT